MTEFKLVLERIRTLYSEVEHVVCLERVIFLQGASIAISRIPGSLIILPGSIQ
jgi:hypothetical protein